MEIDKNMKLSLGINNFISIAVVIAGFIGMYYTLAAEIELAKRLPEQSITAQDMAAVREDIGEIKDTLKKLDDRLYAMGEKD
tara:strand:+ start:1817 stop:2062 length:246 start_codon:yes stop_codon:yes gene_type:complete